MCPVLYKAGASPSSTQCEFYVCTLNASLLLAPCAARARPHGDEGLRNQKETLPTSNQQTAGGFLKLNPSTPAVGAAPPARGLPQAPRPRCEPPPQSARPTGFGCGSRWLNLQTSSPYNAKGHRDLFIYLGSPNFISGERKKGLESSRLGPAPGGFAREPRACVSFSMSQPLPRCSLSVPPPNTHTPKMRPHTHTLTPIWGWELQGRGFPQAPAPCPEELLWPGRDAHLLAELSGEDLFASVQSPSPWHFPPQAGGKAGGDFGSRHLAVALEISPSPRNNCFLDGVSLPQSHPRLRGGGW